MDENLKTVNIYTDGACSGNPGPGGWGAILEFGPHKKEMHGYMAGTTNNRMELFAANQDLWFILTAQTKKHHVEFIKVKGHADHPENNRCDELAREGVKELMEMEARAQASASVNE